MRRLYGKWYALYCGGVCLVGLGLLDAVFAQDWVDAIIRIPIGAVLIRTAHPRMYRKDVER